MNLAIQILFTTALVAGLMVLRLYADRHNARGKSYGGRGNTACRSIGCFRHCDPDPAATAPAADNNPPRRSADHAP